MKTKGKKIPGWNTISFDVFLRIKFNDEGVKAKNKATYTLTDEEWHKLQQAFLKEEDYKKRIQSWIDYSYHLKSIIGKLSWKDKKYYD